MSDNPFDVFAADFKAAIPSTGDKSGNQNDQPINIMAEPSPAPVPVMNAPVMNAPVMNQQQQPQTPQQQPAMGMNGMGMNGMGMMNNQPPVGMYGGGGFGMTNGMQQPPAPMMGGMQGAGAPGAMVPSVQQSNPYAMNMGGGMPSYGQSMGQHAPPSLPGMGMGVPQYGGAPPTMAPPPAATAAAPVPPPAETAAPSPFGMAPPTPGMAPPTSEAAAPTPFGMTAPVPPPESAPVAPPPPSNDPYGAPATTAPVPVPPALNDPFGAPAPLSADPFAPAPAQPSPAPAMPPASDDPWAQPAPATNDAIVPVPSGMSDDPFGVFSQGPPPTDVLSVATPNPTTQYTSEQVQAAADDPWSSGPFSVNNDATPAPANSHPAPSANNGGGLLGDDAIAPAGGGAEGPKSGELPPGGEWYDARIFTPTLGVMFFKPQELTDSLFLQTERTLVNALDDRPVVAFIVEGSSARAAGVELGHVLLKVNGIDVKNPKEASRLIKEGPRPLPLLFYVPDTNVVVAEGEHMVKYDTRDTTAPNSAKDWKPKYVVIGGIIAQPWMMNMYRSKVRRKWLFFSL